jgi:aspartate/methionine/tyrosine aminotransferase
VTVVTFLVIEVAIGEYDADIAELAAEAAKSISERRKAPRTTTTGNEEVVKTISGKWQRSVNQILQKLVT